MSNMKLLNQKLAHPKQLNSGTPYQLSHHIKGIIVFVVLSLLLVSPARAQTNGDLPPRILELVPPDAVLISQQFTATPMMSLASFIAEKTITVIRKAEYKLEIMAFDNSSPVWKMREPLYRNQIDDRTEKRRAGLAPESANQGMFTADPVKETKNSWGSGLTQRILNHPPQADQYVTYNCAYYGMIGGIVFELFASGVPDSPDECDKWAQSVADVVSTLTISNIGN